MIVAAHEYTLPRRNTTLAACLSVFIGTQVFLIIAILRDARSLILMHPNAARRNAMTSPVSRYTRMLAPVSRCAGPCPDARAAIAMYFTPPRCRRPYRGTGQPPSAKMHHTHAAARASPRPTRLGLSRANNMGRALSTRRARGRALRGNVARRRVLTAGSWGRVGRGLAWGPPAAARKDRALFRIQFVTCIS